MRIGKRLHSPKQQGFTLMMVICALALLAIASDAVVTRLAHQVQRERETELLRVGQAYAQGIKDYYEQTPGSVKRWPENLEELVDDPRFVTVKRHIRQLYPDPTTGSTGWIIERNDDGRIVGVHSSSTQAPLQTAGIDLGVTKLEAAKQYSDWRFVYHPIEVTPR